MEELKLCFLKSGYPDRMVTGIIQDVLRRERRLDYQNKSKTAPFPVAWIQTYGPATEQLRDVIKEANNVLTSSPNWKGENRVIGLVSRRAKNLADRLLKKKQFALETGDKNTGTRRCTPKLKPGQRRKVGRPCESCNMMSNKSAITSKATGKIFRTPSGSCKTKRLVYAADCLLCQKQYSGQTTNNLRTRINGHRSHMTKEFDPNKDTRHLDEATLAQHLKEVHNLDTVELFNTCYTFSILEVDPQNLDRCEQKWVNNLKTMRPFGLNIEKPCGVVDSLLKLT